MLLVATDSREVASTLTAARSLRAGLLMLLLAVTGASLEAAPADDPLPLAGYPELTIAVEGLPRTAHDAGVQRSELKSLMERALRRGGVRVLSPDDMPLSVGPVPSLVLTLHMLKAASLDGTSFVYHLRLACTRPATTPENKRQVTGVLWEREAIDSGQRAVIRSHIGDSMSQLLEAFLNDWRPANPRDP